MVAVPRCTLVLATLLGALAWNAPANNSVHTSWLWHLHQPIYWPDRRNYGADHYENAWDSIQQQDGGRQHPSPEILRNIFGLDDRRNAYQSGPSNSLHSILGYPKSGVQISYSGALMENVQSLGGAGQLGYGANWYQWNRSARRWTTAGGKPRMDLVNFTYHHALAPLISDETLEMELRIHKRQMEIFWTTTPATSRGYFLAETCFTARMIPILKKVGIEWSIIANTHLARACPDLPILTGSGGEMCDLPNRADQLNPAQGAGNYRRLQIDRGCSPVQVMPFGFQLHYARYVDPETGAESKLIVVPSDQVLGWKDSYSQWDLNLLNALATRNDTSKPALVLCAHDGDNAWSGGFSYYNEWVPNMASQAASRGYEPTTVEQFIADHPVDTNDVVHVEDGGWVNADGDFGSPIFANWHWPPSYSSGGVNVVDPSLGVSDKADNWRVIIATENRVKTAQQISGLTPNVDQVRDPGSFSGVPNGVELGWHYYLASLDSGFVYYGCHDDECQRATAAQSNAVRNTSPYLADLAGDTTPPTIFIPQRHPWNPGGTNFGVQYGYRVTVATNSDFWVWTYAYDASGITNVSLKFRNDGTNPPASGQFNTYAGGPLAGAWQTSPMTQRVVAPVTGVTPQFIADYYYAKVTGVSNAFVDYYVTATDSRGNTFKSPIQHVWVGQNPGGSAPSTPPTPTGLTATPINTNQINLAWTASSGASGYLVQHTGSNVAATATTSFFDTGLATDTAYCYSIIATNAVGVSAPSAARCATTLASASTNLPAFAMDGAPDSTNFLVASSGMTLYAALRGTKLYVATRSPGNSGPSDHFIFVSDVLLPSANAAAPWAKSGKTAVATSKPFLAGESVGSYVSWFNAPAGSQAVKAATNSGAMEGTIDLVAAFGAMPANIYLCAAAYQTADGGVLASSCPTNAGPDIGTNGFFSIPLVALRDHNGDGKYDRLDPLLDFKLLDPRAESNGLALTWASFPGRAYQLETVAALGGAWSNVPGSTLTAGVLQAELQFTAAITNGNGFFRARLLH